MLEKFLLAIGLTFALSLFAELTLPSSKQVVQEPSLHKHSILVLSQRHN
jgi:hypothetical protein